MPPVRAEFSASGAPRSDPSLSPGGDRTYHGPGGCHNRLRGGLIMRLRDRFATTRWQCATSHAVGVAATGALLLSGAAGQQPQRPEFQPIADEPGLPRVLVIGDSISIGYTLPLREALKGVANVHRPPTNCEHTWKGLEELDQWLGDGDWDLIHFNWGLHDLKHVDGEGRLELPPAGRQVSTLAEYASNLDKLVMRLKQTGAKLIWRPTTPVPKGAQGRIPADLPKYNQAAREVIERHGIEIDDMNAFIKAQKIPQTRPDNVHFSAESSAVLAGNSAEVIRKTLRSD